MCKWAHRRDLRIGVCQGNSLVCSASKIKVELVRYGIQLWPHMRCAVRGYDERIGCGMSLSCGFLMFSLVPIGQEAQIRLFW